MPKPLTKEEREALSRQVEQEARELRDAPFIVVTTGQLLRCHFCGAVSTQLYEMERLGPQGQQYARHGCENCHPEVRSKVWQTKKASTASVNTEPQIGKESKGK